MYAFSSRGTSEFSDDEQQRIKKLEGASYEIRGVDTWLFNGRRSSRLLHTVFMALFAPKPFSNVSVRPIRF